MSCRRFATRSSYRWTQLVLLGLVLVSLGGCSRRDRPPNILLVTLDTTRRDHLGCYSGGSLTPNFDRLAREGVRFDMAISTSAATPVAHASILTGLNQYRHGVRVIHAASGYRLRETAPTLAQILRDRDWRTAAFLSSFTVSSHFGFDRGFEVFDEGLEHAADKSFVRQPSGFWSWPQTNQRRANETTDRAIEWISGTAHPFFAWVHYWDPHDEQVLPPDAVLRRFVAPHMTGEQRKRAIYEADVHFMDAEFGRLIEALEQEDLYENTIIVVLADHGEGLGQHGWWYHRLLYQEQIQIPFLMRVPGWRHGVAVPDLVRNIDIAPTILELLGIDAPRDIDGVSVAGLARGEQEPESRIAYADAINLFDLNASLVDRRPDDALLYSVIEGDWKLIHRPLLDGKDELYDLSNDPAEQNNLVATEPQQRDRLKARLDRLNGYVTEPFGESMDEKTIERLKSLGYM